MIQGNIARKMRCEEKSMFADGIRGKNEEVIFEQWTKELKEELSQFWVEFNNR